jgi:hypothetical protein
VDPLHLAHLAALCLWGGCVLAEGVVELVPKNDAEREHAARVHFWIDVLIELPLIAAVLTTGAVLMSRSWPPSPLLAVKVIAGLVALGLNIFCAVMVVLRYVRRIDPVAVGRYAARVRWSGVGVPFALVAAYIGLAYFAGLG